MQCNWRPGVEEAKCGQCARRSRRREFRLAVLYLPPGTNSTVLYSSTGGGQRLGGRLLEHPGPCAWSARRRGAAAREQSGQPGESATRAAERHERCHRTEWPRMSCGRVPLRLLACVEHFEMCAEQRALVLTLFHCLRLWRVVRVCTVLRRIFPSLTICSFCYCSMQIGI